MRSIVFLLCIVYAQIKTPAFEQLAWKAIHALYNCDFSNSIKYFKALQRKYPQHPGPLFLEAVLHWWKIQLDPYDKRYDKDFLAVLDKVDDYLSYLPEGEEKDFIYFVKEAFLARYYSRRGSYTTAVRHAWNCLPALKRNYKLLHLESLMGKGLYNYYKGWYEERYPIMRYLLAPFPEGNREKGLQLMQQCAAARNYMQIEAHFYLSDIFLFDYSDPNRAFPHVYFLYQRYPNNPRFQYLMAYLQFLKKDYKAALQIIRDNIAQFDSVAQRYGERFTAEVFRITPWMVAQFYSLAARIYVQSAPKKTIQMADKALYYCGVVGAYEEEPAVYISLYYKGLAYEQLKRYKDAREVYKTALDAEPDEIWEEKIEKRIKKLP